MLLLSFFSSFVEYLFVISRSCNKLVRWKVLGISPHGKYYRPAPRSPWLENTASHRLYRTVVGSPPVPLKNYPQRRVTAFYYDPLAPFEAPKWRKSDIFPANTPYYFRIGQGPLPPAKKDYRDPAEWVDPHLSIFKDVDSSSKGGPKKFRREHIFRKKIQVYILA